MLGQIEIQVATGHRILTLALDPAHLSHRTVGDLVTAQIVSEALILHDHTEGQS